eukprot:1316524-Rhodomonas_salina.1
MAMVPLPVVLLACARRRAVLVAIGQGTDMRHGLVASGLAIFSPRILFHACSMVQVRREPLQRGTGAGVDWGQGGAVRNGGFGQWKREEGRKAGRDGQ